MRDAVNPEEPGGGVPHKGPKVRAISGWYVILGVVTVALLAGAYLMSV